MNLLNQVCEAIRFLHLSQKTERAYVDWIYRYSVFHNNHLPPEIKKEDLNTFLNFLSNDRKISASTRHQARQAIIFLYREVFEKPIVAIQDNDKVKITKQVPVTFTRVEIKHILEVLKDEAWLMVTLLYGCGLRLSECLNLRLKDIDIEKMQLHISHESKYAMRSLPLPQILQQPLTLRINWIKIQHQQRLQDGFCGASLPKMLAIKHPSAPFDLDWQYIFPSDHHLKEQRLHHRHESFLHKAVKKALIKAKIDKPASCHTFRHSFAAHLVEAGHDIHVVQKLLGHSDVRTTIIYKNFTPNIELIKSPLDELQAKTKD
ncbi:integron integrase [Solitalea lacus]|uniref:integron integrase n=1 Tax=Solitalea lacus TaxID=2911172 RepID=UPI001EDA7D5C|nr:integron integrase [Solitalea lacus]UKJ06232.1 integron integrase [Solitalea lacus]